MKKIFKFSTKPSALNVLLNFSEGKTHGCQFNCQFCGFKLFDIPSVPDNETLKSAIIASGYENVVISGGGEPLFNYESNKDELLRISLLIKSMDRKVHLITHDVDTILKYYNDEFFDNVSSFILSTQSKNNKFLECINLLKSAGKNVAINRLLQHSDSFDDLCSFVEFYKDADLIKLRENYLETWEDNEIYLIKSKIECKYKDKVVIRRTAPTPMLYNNTLTSTIEIDMIIKEMLNGSREMYEEYFK